MGTGAASFATRLVLVLSNGVLMEADMLERSVAGADGVPTDCPPSPCRRPAGGAARDGSAETGVTLAVNSPEDPTLAAAIATVETGPLELSIPKEVDGALAGPVDFVAAASPEVPETTETASTMLVKACRAAET